MNRASSPDYAEQQVRDIYAFDYPNPFQIDRSDIEVAEQGNSATKQDRGQIDLYLVDQPNFETLLDDFGPHDINIFVTSRPLCLSDRALNPIRYEGEWRPWLDLLLGNRMRYDKIRRIWPTRWAATPSPGDVECPASGDGGACIHPWFPDEIGARLRDFENHVRAGKRELGIAG